MQRLEFEARGVTCLECKGLDLTTHPDHAQRRAGKCLPSGPDDAARVFVRIHMARNCWYFVPADSYQGRD